MNHARMSTFITHLISLPTRVCSKLFTLSNILHLIWGTFSNVPQFSLLPHESLSLYHDTRWRSVFVHVKQQKRRLTYLFIICRTTEMKIAHTLNVLDNKLLYTTFIRAVKLFDGYWHNSLHLEQIHLPIFFPRHYLSLEIQTISRTLPLHNCSLLGQISNQIFTLNGGYCLGHQALPWLML